MGNKENVHKKSSYKWNVIGYVWLSVLVFLFFIGVHIMKKSVQSNKGLRYCDELDTVWVVNPVNNRNGLFCDDFEYVIDSGSELVENNDGYDDWKIYRKADPFGHNISHLPGPYYMYKAANNDTIVVIKDGYVLKFKMPQPDTVLRRERFWRD